MAIFGSTKQVAEVEELDVVVDESTITPTMECSDQILMEFAEDMYKVQSGLYVADILIEEKICTEGYSEDIEVVAEATIKDSISKVIENFKKLWAKIKAWFKSVIDNFKVRITSQKNFLAKYEAAINDKLKDKDVMKGFNYTDYEYNYKKLHETCTKARDQIKDKVKDVTGLTVDQLLDSNTDIKSVEEMKDSEYMTKLCNAIGGSACNNGADVKKHIVNSARSAKTNLIEFKDINVKEMISYCKEPAADNIKNTGDEMDKMLNGIISKFKEAENKANENKGSVSTFHTAASTAQKLVALSQNITSTQVKMINAINSSYISTLKRILTYKGKSAAKENTTSLLESAMSLIG